MIEHSTERAAASCMCGALPRTTHKRQPTSTMKSTLALVAVALIVAVATAAPQTKSGSFPIGLGYEVPQNQVCKAALARVT